MSTSKVILILLMILAILSAVFISFYSPGSPKTTTAIQNSKALIGGPFTLIDHHGKHVTNEDFRGKYMLIYFGYTYCPDICPMELQNMSDALDRVSEETLSQITPLFITFDPERDRVKEMADYIQYFHPKMIGLTGSMEQIKAVKKAYRVYSAKDQVKEGDDPAAYTIGHSSYTYLMDRNGEYVTHFRRMTSPEVMARKLQEIIR
ncbi:MAG: SCO family protein [Alphaproteobacteria bacterium]|nr:MAG: SCO family protein [Alphaproteobacteria bacterium]